MSNLSRTHYLLWSIAFYVACLATPAVTDTAASDIGLSYLCIGAIGLLLEFFDLKNFFHLSVLLVELPWIANPLLFITWAMMAMSRTETNKWTQRATRFGNAAFFFSISFLLTKYIPLDSSSDAPTWVSLQVGYYLWVFSIVLAVLPSWLPWLHNVIKRQTPPQSPNDPE